MKSNWSIAVAVITSGLVTMSACSSDVDPNAPPPLPVAAQTSATTMLVGPSDTSTDDFLLTTAKYDQELSRIIYHDRSDTWEDVHARVEAYMTEVPEDERAFAYQMAAPKVLTEFILPGAASGEKAAAAAFYVDMLAESGSPQADLVLRTVRKFGGSWSSTYTKDVAGRAAMNAFKYLETKGGCEDCAARGREAASLPDEAANLEIVRTSALELENLATVE